MLVRFVRMLHIFKYYLPNVKTLYVRIIRATQRISLNMHSMSMEKIITKVQANYSEHFPEDQQKKSFHHEVSHSA